MYKLVIKTKIDYVIRKLTDFALDTTFLIKSISILVRLFKPIRSDGCVK